MPKKNRPSAPEVPLPAWRGLLDAARAVRAVEPWEWMDDTDVFALVDEENRPWFPSVQALPVNKEAALEFDVFHLMTPVADGARPYFPRMAMLADGASGYIHAMEMAPPERAWGDLVVATWSKGWSSLQARPEAIAIRRSEWLPPLAPLAAALGLRVDLRVELPFIDEARASLELFHRR